MSFQTHVNILPAPAVEGDFASANPRATVLTGEGAFVAGQPGLTVGRFAWVDPGGRRTASNQGAGTPDGFVGREMQALITTWLAEQSMVIPPGLICTLYSAGDFWVRNAGANNVTPRMKAYAAFGTGAVTFNVTGTPPAGAAFTGAVAAGVGASSLSTIADNLLTVGGVVTGSFNVGGTVTGAGVAAGTQITQQVTGTPGGAGTYLVTPRNQTIATPQVINETHGVLTVSAVASGAVEVGAVIAGTGVVAGTTVTALGTGNGGPGTYIVSNNTVVASTAMTTPGGIETKWFAMSPAAPGELVQMSSWPLG